VKSGLGLGRLEKFGCAIVIREVAGHAPATHGSASVFLAPVCRRWPRIGPWHANPEQAESSGGGRRRRWMGPSPLRRGLSSGHLAVPDHGAVPNRPVAPLFFQSRPTSSANKAESCQAGRNHQSDCCLGVTQRGPGTDANNGVSKSADAGGRQQWLTGVRPQYIPPGLKRAVS
jgi:hypothetical protein